MRICWRRRCASVANERTRARSSGRWKTSFAGHEPGAFSSWPGAAPGKGTCPLSVRIALPTGLAAAVFLVDTSAWIEVFRRPSQFRLETEIEFEEAVACLPVIQEVLQGFVDEHAFRTASDAMFALPIVESPLDRSVVVEAVDLYRRARRAGKTVRSGVDCVIAACAIRHGLTVLHNDRDYPAIAAVSALQHRQIRLARRV